MNTCMIAYTFYESDNRVRRYAETLTKRGHRVDAIVLRGNGQDRSGVVAGVHQYRLQSRDRNERHPVTYLVKLLWFLILSMIVVTIRHMRTRYDVIHVHSVPDFLVFSTLIPRLLGSAVILDIHDLSPELYGSKFDTGETSAIYRLLLGVEWMSNAVSSHVIIANHIWRDKLIKRTVQPEKCTTIMNYPDPTIFTGQPAERRSGDHITICYPGSLNWHQGVDLMVNAMERIVKRHPTSRFMIIGDGPERHTLETLIAEKQLGDYVSLTGVQPLERIAEMLKSIDIGVVPKRAQSFGNEAFSTKILEFMAMGVPVVASNTKVDQYYFDASNIEFFQSDNIDDLERAVTGLIENDARRVELRENGLRYVSSHNWTVRSHEYLDVLRGLVGEGHSV